MSFPNIVFGSPGDQFTTGTTQTADPGTLMCYEDGRKFRYVLKSSAAAVAGDIQAGAARDSNHVAQTPVAAAVGATQVATALGATISTADQYKDGFLCVELGTGFGYAYQIASHGSIATGGNVPLREPVQVAIPATASSISLVPSPYRLVVVAPVTPLGQPLGSACKPIAASAFGWVQTRGICTATVVASTVIGNSLTIITTAGSLGPTASVVSPVIALAQNTVVAATNKGTVFMLSEG